MGARGKHHVLRRDEGLQGRLTGVQGAKCAGIDGLPGMRFGQRHSDHTFAEYIGTITSHAPPSVIALAGSNLVARLGLGFP